MHSNTTSKEDEKIGNTSYPDEDKISIKNQSLEDAHITINIMKTIEQMNMAQIKVNPETGKVDTFDGNTTIMQNQEHGNTRNT